MDAGVRAGTPLARSDWLALRSRAIFDFCKWDVQSDDHSVLADFPLLLDASVAAFLQQKAEALAAEALAAEREILNRSRLLRRLGLPGKIQKLLESQNASGSFHHGVRVIRFDFHFTSEGWKISEANADVPGGFIEAAGWNGLFGSVVFDSKIPASTSDIYTREISRLAQQGGIVALVHATGYSDDTQVMLHLARCFEKQGARAVLASPEHIHWNEGRAELRSAVASGQASAIVRFFPAEWLPSLPPRNAWQMYFSNTSTIQSNPGSAMLIQTKRFPLIWDELGTKLQTWRDLLPKTREPKHMKSVLDDYSILKPALGRVGEGIGMPGVTRERELLESFVAARSYPGQWVAQERFAAIPIATEKCAMFYCIGAFTVNGKAAGFYGRVSERPLIDQNAQDAAVLIVSNGKGNE